MLFANSGEPDAASEPFVSDIFGDLQTKIC